MHGANLWFMVVLIWCNAGHRERCGDNWESWGHWESHISWKRILARSNAFEASDRSIAVSMVRMVGKGRMSVVAGLPKLEWRTTLGTSLLAGISAYICLTHVTPGKSCHLNNSEFERIRMFPWQLVLIINSKSDGGRVFGMLRVFDTHPVPIVAHGSARHTGTK